MRFAICKIQKQMVNFIPNKGDYVVHKKVLTLNKPPVYALDSFKPKCKLQYREPSSLL